MRILFSIVALLFSLSMVEAAQKEGVGSTGLSFSCDVSTLECSCAGEWEGADCVAMRKNCDKNEGSHCIGSKCFCPMTPIASQNRQNSKDTKSGLKGGIYRKP